MIRTISLAVFFVVILAAVFWFTGMQGSGPQEEQSAMLRVLVPKVQVISAERSGAEPKFQLAISSDPSALNQMNRESSAVAARVRSAVVLVKTRYAGEAPPKNRKKGEAAPEEFWHSSGVVLGEGGEVLTVIPNRITPQEVLVRTQDGAEFPAGFVGRDDSTEIALLQVDRPLEQKGLSWRNRRTLEWGENLFALGRSGTHGAQMARVMVGGDAVLVAEDGKVRGRHYQQLDQYLPADFQGAALVDANGQLAGLVLRPSTEGVRAVVLDAGSIRSVVESLRSLQKAAGNP